MLLVFLPIFVAATKIIYGYNFVALLTVETRQYRSTLFFTILLLSIKYLPQKSWNGRITILWCLRITVI